MFWFRAALLLAFVAFGWLVGPTLADDVAGCTDQGYTNGNDNQSHGGGSQLRCGLNGNDNMDGGGGDDGLDGDGDNDTLHGGPGDDHLFGDVGDDDVRGEDGDDFVEGGPGEDDLEGDDGDDTLEGGPGLDVQEGGPGLDTFLVSAGDVPNRRKETLDGGPNQDTARFFFGNAGDPCPAKKRVKDPNTTGKYVLKSIRTCTFGP
jgi:Ca2+-binding RTX toxin-like protein